TVNDQTTPTSHGVRSPAVAAGSGGQIAPHRYHARTGVNWMNADPIQQSIVALCVDTANGPIAADISAAATIRIMDTFAAFYAAWPVDNCKRARKWAQSAECRGTATVLGTAHRVRPETAAFVNGLAARSSELNDTVHVSGKQ